MTLVLGFGRNTFEMIRGGCTDTALVASTTHRSQHCRS